MRVNVEDDIFLSGRLSKLARSMGWSDQQALGALVMVWHDTQHREIVEASLGELVELLSVRFASESECEAFIKQMASARLANIKQTSSDAQADSTVGSNDVFFIVGNEKHVARISSYKKNASIGGKKSAEKRQANLKQALSKPQASAKQTPTEHQADSTLLSPISYLQKEEREKEEHDGSVDPVTAQTFVEQPTRAPMGNEKFLGQFVLSHYASEARLNARECPTRFDLGHSQAATKIAHRFPLKWQKIVSAYLADDKWQFCGWSLEWLAKNVDEVAGKLSTTSSKAKRKLARSEDLAASADELMAADKVDSEQAKKFLNETLLQIEKGQEHV